MLFSTISNPIFSISRWNLKRIFRNSKILALYTLHKSWTVYDPSIFFPSFWIQFLNKIYKVRNKLSLNYTCRIYIYIYIYIDLNDTTSQLKSNSSCLSALKRYFYFNYYWIQLYNATFVQRLCETHTHICTYISLRQNIFPFNPM